MERQQNQPIDPDLVCNLHVLGPHIRIQLSREGMSLNRESSQGCLTDDVQQQNNHQSGIPSVIELPATSRSVASTSDDEGDDDDDDIPTRGKASPSKLKSQEKHSNLGKLKLKLKNREKHSDLSKLKLKLKIPKKQCQNIEVATSDIINAQKKLKKLINDDKHFWKNMYDLLMEAFISKCKSQRNFRRKFVEIIETLVFSLVSLQDNALNNLKRMRKYLNFKEDSDASVCDIESFEVATNTDVTDQQQIRSLFLENETLINLMEHNVLPFSSMTEILQNISAPEDIAFIGYELHEDFPMPIKLDKNRKVQALRIKLHKPTLIHLIKIHVKSPWKIEHEDRQKIVASLTKAAGNRWTINQDIIVRKPETGVKDIFSILYKNPITKIDVCKNYNVVLIDHLYMVPSRNNEKILDVVSYPMLLTNGDIPVVGFNLFGPNEAVVKHERKVKLEHLVLDTAPTKKMRLNK